MFIMHMNMYEYVWADTCIGPTGEDLPSQWFHDIKSNVVELRALREFECRKSKCLQEAQENCDIEAHVMKEAEQHLPESQPSNANANMGLGNWMFPPLTTI